ncbi:MAG: ATP-binding protein [Candidatus Gastranaerophilaceae bacterium]
MFERSVKENIEKWLYRGKVIVIYGARRTGKTTLSKQILKEQEALGKKVKYLNCELLNVKLSIETTNEMALKSYLNDNDLVVLDEAQNISKIGHILKILVDTYPQIQIIATGSSSFELSNQVGEPLVGRSREFILYPLSIGEIMTKYDLFEIGGKMDNILRYGLYPSVFDLAEEDAIEELNNITSKYLYKDILAFDNIKNSNILLDLLRLLALQVGNEVSFNEIGQKLGLSSMTVSKYIDLLEKCFIVFSLGSFSRNLRKEIGKSKKIYFYDLGIRNSLIANFNQLALRTDAGFLWENFCIIERMKFNEYNKKYCNKYFWRMYSGQEIDYIEEHDGKLDAYEFKYNAGAKVKLPLKFLNTYENTSYSIINQDNWFEFFGHKS